jgi:hypothetical protein
LCYIRSEERTTRHDHITQHTRTHDGRIHSLHAAAGKPLDIRDAAEAASDIICALNIPDLPHLTDHGRLLDRAATSLMQSRRRPITQLGYLMSMEAVLLTSA